MALKGECFRQLFGEFSAEKGYIRAVQIHVIGSLESHAISCVSHRRFLNEVFRV